MASIWERTNVLLVAATVTTRTMEALPMITPSDVSMARSLLARKASMATVKVSRIFMVFYCSNSPESELERFGETLAFFEFLQLFLCHLVLWIESKRILEFFLRFFHLVPAYVQAPQPNVPRCRRRIATPFGRSFRILLQQVSGFLWFLFLQNQRDSPVKLGARIIWRHSL